MSQAFKKLVYTAAMSHLDERIDHLQNLVFELEQSKANESKSSAGDKYETARAMMQQELDLLQRQLMTNERLKSGLGRLNPAEKPASIGANSLVRTQQGWFYLAVALGKVLVSGETVHVISVDSPFAQKLINAPLPHKSAESTGQAVLEHY